MIIIIWLFQTYFGWLSWISYRGALPTLILISSTEKPVSPKGTQLTKNYYSVVSENDLGHFSVFLFLTLTNTSYFSTWNYSISNPLLSDLKSTKVLMKAKMIQMFQFLTIFFFTGVFCLKKILCSPAVWQHLVFCVCCCCRWFRTSWNMSGSLSKNYKQCWVVIFDPCKPATSKSNDKKMWPIQ